MTDLILIRHGNTFEDGNKTVWAGARTDLPLTEKGRAQAHYLGVHLSTASPSIRRLVTGPLRRTLEHAEIIAGLTGFPRDQIEISPALREIDYGPWEGLSTDEIISLGGRDALEAWDKSAIWPESVGWSPEEAALKTGTADLLGDIAEHALPLTCLITSNGILRFFARHAVNPPATAQLKVRTGHYCHMCLEKDGWHIKSWNISPETPLTT